MIDLAERFKRLVSSASREGHAIRLEPPDPEQDHAVPVIAPIVLPRELLNKVSDWLEDEMEKAVRSAHISHLNHAEVSYSLGIETGLRLVRDRLNKWSGQAS